MIHIPARNIMPPHHALGIENEDALQRDIFHALALSSEPMPGSRILKALANPQAIKLPQLEEYLETLADGKKITRFGPYRSKTPRYWDRQEEEYVRKVILEKLDGRSLTQSELLRAIKAPLKGISENRRKATLKALIAEGAIGEYPAFLGGRTKRICLGVIEPDEYVADALQKITQRLVAKDIPESAIRTAVRTWLEPGSPESPSDPPAQSQVQSIHTKSISETILSAAVQFFPQASRGALVSISKFRNIPVIAQLDRAAVDQSLLQLARERVIALHAHDFPLGLSLEARKHLLQDEKGNYYIGFALRS
jgi:hypothetical protein